MKEDEKDENKEEDNKEEENNDEVKKERKWSVVVSKAMVKWGLATEKKKSSYLPQVVACSSKTDRLSSATTTILNLPYTLVHLCMAVIYTS